MLFLNRLRSKIGVMMKKKWILPVIAGVIVIIALAVIFLVPKKSEEPGVIPYSCWMGMIRSTIEAE